MNDCDRIKKTVPPQKTVSMVLDTDTFNEVDDQFALTYAYKLQQSGRIKLEAVYAAPFTHDPSPTAGEGMEQSYAEIVKILGKLGKTDVEGFALRGSDRFMEDGAVDSPAARDLIEKAMAHTPDEPLFVVAIGAITNVASAILMQPEIMERIVVVWLGGTEIHQDFANEYNLEQDPIASRLILDCGVPLVQLPCKGVVESFKTTVSELERFIDGKTEIGTYLTSLVRACDNGRASTRVIWDVTAVGYVVHPEWFTAPAVHTPRLTQEPEAAAFLRDLPCYRHQRARLCWSHDADRHLMRAVTSINRNELFYDLFQMINA